MPSNANKRLIIRCDASASMGIGHVLRCLAFASLWGKPEQVFFVSSLAESQLKERITGHGYNYVAVASSQDPNSLEPFGSILEPQTQNSVLPTILLDGYHFSSTLQAELRNLAHQLIVWDDDNQLSQYHAHVILNDGVGFKATDYNALPNTLFLLGADYILLRDEFLKVPQHLRGQAKVQAKSANKILLSFGGADPQNLSLATLNLIKNAKIKNLELKIVAGPAYKKLDELKASVSAIKQAGQHSIEILHNVNDMPALMLWADLALGAAGGTAFELGYLGVPQLCFVVAENQRFVANWLKDNQAALVFKQFCELELANFINILENQKQRTMLANNAQKLIDGKGRERLKELLITGE